MKPSRSAADAEIIFFPAAVHIVGWLFYKFTQTAVYNNSDYRKWAVTHESDADRLMFVRVLVINAVIIAFLFLVMRQLAVFDKKYYHSIQKKSQSTLVLKKQNFMTVLFHFILVVVTFGIILIFPYSSVFSIFSKISEGFWKFVHWVVGSTLEAELDKLKDWFRTMPRLKLRDYQNHEKLAEELCYMRVSRKELYEVYAAIFILKRYAHVKVGNQDYKAIKDYVKKVESLLSSDWTEKAYEDLWDRVLTLPSVEAEILKVGKQKGTTFNRKLVANILHLMMQNGVFAVTATNQAMAEALEGTKDHSVRAEVGLALDDPSMKSAITRLIENK